jgi:hypothetical protein
MHCLFCKKESTGSRSQEHIIPESLGNTRHVLPVGLVCDSCNNYFSREVEKPFLESAAITVLRFHQAIPSKRGRVPSVQGVLVPRFPVMCWKEPKDSVLAHVALEEDGLKHLLSYDTGRIILPAEGIPPRDRVVSRFLAKAGLEALASRLVKYPEGLEYLVTEPQLDPVRDHARRGTLPDWPYHVRRIYDANRTTPDERGSMVQVVHEFDILQTDSSEYYFILAIFGLEFALNLGGPEVDGYLAWLNCHEGSSPLYWGKNAG